MTYNFNDVEPHQGTDLIPDGSFAKVVMTVRPGGVDGQGEHDKGLLKASNTPGSDVLSLDCEFTVAEGPHARRKFWQLFTAAGGKVDENGASIGWNISKRMVRAMIDSALGARSGGHERSGPAETPAARSRRSERHRLRCQDHGRAQQRSALPGPQPARPPGAAEREGMAGGDERRGGAAGAVAFPRHRRRFARAGPDPGRVAAAASPARASLRGAGLAAAGGTGGHTGACRRTRGTTRPDGRTGRTARARSGAVRARLAERMMTDDEWQAHVTREAARAVGAWLEARGRLPPAHPLFDHGRARSDGVERHCALHRAGLGADRDAPEAGRRSRPPLDDRRPCALCGREARGFGFCLRLQWDRYPHYGFCSMRCLDAGSALAGRITA